MIFFDESPNVVAKSTCTGLKIDLKRIKMTEQPST